jgi:hypothetical protein
VSMKLYAKTLSLGFIALLSIILFVPVVSAQDSNSDDSIAKPDILIFYEHFLINSDSVLHTDGDNVTVRLAVGMPDLNSWVARPMVTSVYYNASWEKEQQIPLYTGETAGPVIFDFVVPIGSQHLEIYATGKVTILGMENGKEIVRTTYGNSTASFDITVAHPTPTPSNTPVNPQSMYDQNLLLLMVIVTIFSFVLAGIVLFFRNHRNTAEKPN